jgi:flagellar motor switch protein FliM
MTSLPSEAGFEEVQLQTVDELPRGLAALLDEIHDVARRSLQSMLREVARATITVTRADAVQTSYANMTRDIEIPSAVASVHSSALNGHFIVHLDAQLSSGLIDLKLGGKIRPATDRWPTNTDVAVLSMMLQKLITPLQDAFRPVFQLDYSIDNFETSPSFIFEVAPADPVVAYRYELTLDDQAIGAMTFIFPFASLQQLLAKVPAGNAMGIPQEEPEIMDLNDVEVELRALIGPTSVGVGEFLSLQPGDVLVLDQWADEPSIGMVHGVPLLELTVGAATGHVAALVERWKD